MDIKKQLNILFILTISLNLMAENSIIGRVLDNSSRQAIDFANVSLTREGESAPVTGTSTDLEGEFVLAGMSNGKYVLKISFMGYNDHTQVISLNGQPLNLGKIYLVENTQNLTEVEVVGQGTTMRFELDKKIFTVDQNIAAAGGSVSEALAEVPSVDVDQEGNISLRNSDAVEVWINGKPSGLTAENRAQVLQQMPAESIKEIEVITNPSAKYSPEGTAGIINLVMKKDRKAGYYGSLSGNIDYSLASPWTTPPGGRAGFNFNFSKGIVDGYINLGYHYHIMNGQSNVDRYNFTPGDTTRLIKEGHNDRRGGGMFTRAGLDFRVTDRSIIGISGFGMITTDNDKSKGGFSDINRSPTSYTLYQVTHYTAPQSEDNQETIIREYARNEEGTGSHPGWNAMLDWRFEINKEHKLSTSAQYRQFQWNGSTYYIQTENNHEDTQEQLSNNNDRMVQLKADYEWVHNKGKLEAGWQTDLAWRRTYADAWDGRDRTVQLQPYYNDFATREQTHALYITYGNRFWDKFSVQVGLRGEYFMRHMESEYFNLLGQKETFAQDTSYFQLFPSVYLSYDFGSGHAIQLNYTRRIDRPHGHQINPRQNFSDSTNIRYGNAALMPQYSSAVELNYLKTWEKHVISAGLYYRFADDVIQNINYVDGDIMRNTFINLGKRHEAGVEVVIKNRFFGELLQLTTSGSFFYNRMDAAHFVPTINGRELDEITIAEQNIFAGMVRLSASFMFTKTFSGQISGRYRSPRVVAQGKTSHNYSIDIGLRKTFLDRKLALALNVRDLLDSRAHKDYTEGDGFWQFATNRWHSRTISLSVTYNFGNMTKKNETYRDNNSGAMSQYEDGGADE